MSVPCKADLWTWQFARQQTSVSTTCDITYIYIYMYRADAAVWRHDLVWSLGGNLENHFSSSLIFGAFDVQPCLGQL